MRIQVSHTFDCEPALYWELTFDEAFNEKLYKGALEMIERTQLERKEEGDVLRRKVKYVPKQDMPAVIQKLMTGQFSYIEETTYSRSKNQMDVNILPSSMGDKISFKGQLRVRDLGGGRCERTFDAEVNVKIMIVGGTIEKHIADMVKQSYDKAAVEFRKAIQARKG